MRTKGNVDQGIETEVIEPKEIDLEKADVVVMNPPFTRQERLPFQYKEALSQRLKEYEEKLHGQLGLYGYFTCLGDRFVKTGGRLALVLPTTILRLESSQGIRDLLTEDYVIEYIISTYERAAFSEGAQFREILLVARKKQKDITVTERDSNICAIITLKKLPKELIRAKEFAGYFKDLRNKLLEKVDRDYFSTMLITQEELKKNADNLFRLMAATQLDLVKIWSNVKDKDQMTKLSSYLERDDRLARGFEMTLRKLRQLPLIRLYL